ncbi:MAG: YgiT-type zinc finger domain-containing protein [Armatimonadetes bacterium CG_4_10_14_0_8_um_filter_66_14]|nr:MAG: YgiT-type zinc finger domain-containing protein [Armatimonadetes bacterium CG_4_10_14_3_um_filter_59_10]PIZ47552.1 MAG: YgiT-type zinc finger domain-containing protein [Armatimonadetes bacterium CG_4_10_14_0_8_um_filter_66_14]
MKCVICHTGELERTHVEEETRVGNDLLLTPIEALVCDGCGERYYDRPTMKYLERVVEEAARRHDTLRPVGQVFAVAA